MSKCTSTRSSANRSVESVCHHDADSEPEEVSSDDNEQLLAISRAVQKQLKCNKEAIVSEVKDHAETAIQAAVKRAFEERDAEQREHHASITKKQKKTHQFQREGHKIRHQVNEDVLEKIEEAITAIDRKELDAAKVAIEGGKSSLSKQQKLIRLADREENGWEVVKHYLSDDLASDSDDEKAINKARKEALATINKRKSKKKKFRNAPPTNPSESYRYAPKPRFADRRTFEKKVPECYKCGKPGHMQYNCPIRYGR